MPNGSIQVRSFPRVIDCGACTMTLCCRGICVMLTVKVANEESHGTWQRGLAYKVSRVDEHDVWSAVMMMFFRTAGVWTVGEVGERD
jgi:hypothetical protein